MVCRAIISHTKENLIHKKETGQKPVSFFNLIIKNNPIVKSEFLILSFKPNNFIDRLTHIGA